MTIPAIAPADNFFFSSQHSSFVHVLFAHLVVVSFAFGFLASAFKHSASVLNVLAEHVWASQQSSFVHVFLAHLVVCLGFRSIGVAGLAFSQAASCVNVELDEHVWASQQSSFVHVLFAHVVGPCFSIGVAGLAFSQSECLLNVLAEHFWASQQSSAVHEPPCPVQEGVPDFFIGFPEFSFSQSELSVKALLHLVAPYVRVARTATATRRKENII
jgi:hypothetical protein